MQILSFFLEAISFIFTVFGYVNERKRRSNPQVYTVQNVLNQKNISVRIHNEVHNTLVIHGMENDSSFWSNTFNGKYYIILAVVILVLGHAIYSSFLTPLRIAVAVTVIAAAILSIYIFLAIKNQFKNIVSQSFSFAGLVLFYIVSVFSIIRADTDINFVILSHGVQRLIDPAFGEPALVASFLIFIFSFAVCPMIHALRNYRTDHFLWLDFTRYWWYFFAAIFLYYGATNILIESFMSFLNMFPQFLSRLL